jgi:hypothetical protein
MGEYGADWDKMIYCRDDIGNKNYNKEIYNHHNIW